MSDVPALYEVTRTRYATYVKLPATLATLSSAMNVIMNEATLYYGTQTNVSKEISVELVDGGSLELSFAGEKTTALAKKTASS